MFTKDSGWAAFRGAALVLCLALVSPAQVARNRRGGGAFAPDRYALILTDPPVGERYATRESLQTAAARGYQQEVELAQGRVRAALASRDITVTGSVATLLNAIFVVAPGESVDTLKAIPGVAAVVRMRRGQKQLNAATTLMDAPGAWALPLIGGQTNAGKGIKIGVLDSGIDNTHPAFQDSGYTAPSGYPKCNSDPTWSCSDFTNNKVIVARSYVRQIAAGSLTQAPAPATSQPDDYSPRDRDGHGTAVASAAAANPTTGVASAIAGGYVGITGMAPKAYLGNYKIYGSDGVNDYPPEDVWIQAIEDAQADGMDIVNLSSGGPALAGPLDTGAACGLPAGATNYCDPLAAAFENAAKAGMVVVVSAGNSGANSYAINQYPVYGSMASPADAPSVIAAGATLNSHAFGTSVSVAGPGAPSSLQNIVSAPSDSTVYALGGVTAPLVDAGFVGDGYACSALPAGSLSNSFALVQTLGGCDYTTKAGNAQTAGAIGMILYKAPTAGKWETWEDSFVEYVDNFQGPVAGMTNANGVALKNYIDAYAWTNYVAPFAVDPWPQVTIDLSGAERSPDAAYNLLASYSSIGPALGYFPLCGTCTAPPLKPEVVATGGGDYNLAPDPYDYGYLFGFPGMYLAAQNFDPAGELYSTTRYLATNGTSFASPLTAGAAALVKQANPTFTAAQIKSAIVNFSNAQAVPTDDGAVGSYLSVDVRQIGGGLLDAGAAAKATVTASPSTIAFTPVKTGGLLPAARTVTITNLSSSAVTLGVAVAWYKQPSSSVTTLTTDKTSLSLGAAGTGSASATLTVTLAGSVPAAGAYSGNINLTGTGVSMHLPFLFLVGSNALGSGAAYITGNLVPVFGTSFDYIAGQDLGVIGIQALDFSGVPIAGQPITFSASGNTVTMKSVSGEPACSPASSTVSVTCNTDNYGIAYTDVVLGTTPCAAGSGSCVSINAFASGLSTQYIQFYVNIRQQPTTVAALDAAKGNATIAPGSYVAIYGAGLSDYTDVETTSTLPLSLDGVTVSFDAPAASISVPGRLVYVSPTQVNVQVPWELQGQSSAQMKVTVWETEYGNVVTVPVANVAPAFFETTVGNVAALIANTYTFVTPTNPVSRGAGVQLYANGLGPVNNQPASGVPAPSTKTGSTAPTCKNTAALTIGGQTATVSYCGLVPGTPALYEIDATVPTGIAAGPQTVSLTIGGQTTTSTITVK